LKLVFELWNNLRHWFAGLILTIQFKSLLSQNTTSLSISKMWSAFFCAFNITGDTKNFVQISIIFVLFKKIEIWAKIWISPVILTPQTVQTNLWKCQDLINFVIIRWRLNITNKLKVKRRLYFKSFCYCHVSWIKVFLFVTT
jgi:hypothetical protein